MSKNSTPAQTTGQPSSPVQPQCSPTTLEVIPSERRRELYEYVAENGSVSKSHLEETFFPHDRRALCQHLALLRQKGVAEVEDEEVRATLDVSTLPQRQEMALADGRTVTIRPATQRDRDELLETIEAVVEETDYVEGRALASRLERDAQLLRDDGNDVRFFYVATVEGSIQGWSHVSSRANCGFDHVGTITGGVTESYRGEGIGNRLFQYCLDWAESNGYTKLYQNLLETNEHGIDFLKSHGWAAEGRRSDHYRLDGEFHDQIILSYEFSQS